MRRLRSPAGALFAAALVLGACSAGAPPNGALERPDRSPSPSVSLLPSATSGPPSPTPARSELFLVTAFATADLVVMHPARGEVGRIEVGRAPWGVVVAPDGPAYVATLDGVAVVDVERRERLELIPYASALTATPTGGEYRPGGLGIAVAPDGGRVYVGVTTRFPDPGVLEIIDTKSRRVVGSVPVGIRQFDVVVSANGDEVYAINHDSFDVTVVDAATMTVRATIRAAPLGDALGLGSWNKPHYAALAASGTLLMPYKGVLLLELDPTTGASTTRPLQSGTHSQGVLLAPGGRTLFVVGDGPDDTSLGPPALEIIDLTEGSSTVVPLPGSHNDVAVSADSARAYATGGSSREGAPHPDVVTVVELRTATVIGSFPVPGNPLNIVAWPGP